MGAAYVAAVAVIFAIGAAMFQVMLLPVALVLLVVAGLMYFRGAGKTAGTPAGPTPQEPTGVTRSPTGSGTANERVGQG